MCVHVSIILSLKIHIDISTFCRLHGFFTFFTAICAGNWSVTMPQHNQENSNSDNRPCRQWNLNPLFQCYVLLQNTAHYTIHCWVYRLGLTVTVHEATCYEYRLLV
jgi:hypothetical protein